ncbi:MAG: response regulator [Desulforhopalus sp.]|nr:response regulator [Desulforhopalus sp.]
MVQTSKGGTETILLVDDAEPFRSVGQEILNELGYKVITASDGESALELYCKEQKRIDLVLLDLIMPGKDGRECLEELLKVNPRLKVVMTCSGLLGGSTKKLIESRAKGFLSKPYEIGEFPRVIRDVLDSD